MDKSRPHPDPSNRGAGPLRVIPRMQPRTILVANAKGGCGKTTLATNLAAFFANQGKATVLMDYDPQGSSGHWLKLRPAQAASITGITAHSQPGANETRNFHHRLPRDIQRVVVDTPAGLTGTALYNRVSEADLVIIPILPSPIDIAAAENFIHAIHLTGLLRESGKQVLVVANRVRKNTVIFRKLNAFLLALELPRVTYTRDSQLYIRAADAGLGIADMGASNTAIEKDHWHRIGGWIESQFNRTAVLNEQKPAIPSDHRARP